MAGKSKAKSDVLLTVGILLAVHDCGDGTVGVRVNLMADGNDDLVDRIGAAEEAGKMRPAVRMVIDAIQEALGGETAPDPSKVTRMSRRVGRA